MTEFHGAARIETVSNVSVLPRAAWDSLAAGRPYVGTGWLRTLAAAACAPSRYRFFLYYEQGRLLAAAACYATEAEGDLERRLFTRATPLARAAGLRIAPALVCGIGSAHGGDGLLLSPELIGERRDAVCAALIEAVEAHAESEGLRPVFVNVLETESWRRLLVERGYAQSLIAPSVVVPIEWGDFSGYLGYVKARSRRAFAAVKHERNRSRASGIEIRCDHARAGFDARAFELLAAHHVAKNGGPYPFRESFPEALREHCADEAVVYVAAIGERLVGASLALEQPDAIWNAFIGFEAGAHFTYFNLGFYEPIARAIAAGAREVVLGAGAYDAKLARGGRLVRRYVLVGRARRRPSSLLAGVLRLHARRHEQKYAPLYARDQMLRERSRT